MKAKLFSAERSPFALNAHAQASVISESPNWNRLPIEYWGVPFILIAERRTVESVHSGGVFGHPRARSVRKKRASYHLISGTTTNQVTQVALCDLLLERLDSVSRYHCLTPS